MNNPHDNKSPGIFIGRWALLVGLLTGALGASFAPWVNRPPAALVLTAPDLAEFVKFLPEVRDGTVSVQRLFFLLPLFATTFSLPLIVASRLDYPRWARWPILAFAIPLSLTLLPPVWSPSVLVSAEFRAQTVACAFCLGLVVVSRWLKHLPTRPLIALLVPLSLTAPALALWGFFGVQAAIARAYASPVVPGWGAWMTLGGFALTAVAGSLLLTSETQT